MYCRLCGKAEKFVKAHIIPEAFFRVLRNDEKPPLIVTDIENCAPRKRSPIGVYDENILCEACEKNFDKFDAYGIDVLLSRKKQLFRPVSSGMREVALQADGIDRKLLLQFLVATLWRASVSTHEFYRRVNLGPFEEIAREVILNPAHAVPSEFEAVLSDWDVAEDQKTIADGIMDPFAEKLEGVNSYRVYFGQVIAYVKVDRRPFPAPFSKLSLLAQSQVTLVRRNFKLSKDFDVMKKTVMRAHENQSKLSKRGTQ